MPASPDNVYKVNFDAATFLDSSSIGVGVVIRNYAGDFMAGLCKRINLFSDPYIAEAVATYHVVDFMGS